MDEVTPHIEVRAVHVNDAPALYDLDDSFETDRVYTLRVCNRLIQNSHVSVPQANGHGPSSFALELVETLVDPPLYRDGRDSAPSVAEVEARLQAIEGGFVALADGQMAGCILLHVEQERSVALIQDLIVGRQFRRYGVGSLLLRCAADWARNNKCWAIVLETQSVNYPAIQFYLRNDLEIWSVNQHFYPPGAAAHDVAIFMGKRLSTSTDD